MAKRRMFHAEICKLDSFVGLPAGAQALYFHLGLNADDDGFVSSPNSVIRGVNRKKSDLKQLIVAGYVIKFESGAIVLTDWNICNKVPPSRYTETLCLEEKAQLFLDEGNRYHLKDVNTMQTNCLQNDEQT